MTTPHDDHTAEPAAEPVAAALARLDDLADRPVGAHVEVYDDIHGRLRDALEEAAVDPATQPPG